MDRLTAENITTGKINDWAVNHANDMGLYTREEFESLKKADVLGWEFDFIPSQASDNFGKVRLMPKSRRSVTLLDKGRSYILRSRHPNKDISVSVGMAFISEIKRNHVLNKPHYQDFFINYHNELKSVDSVDDLIPLFKDAGIRVRENELFTVLKYLPRVIPILDGDVKPSHPNKRPYHLRARKRSTA